jgi:hypothetical protein
MQTSTCSDFDNAFQIQFRQGAARSCRIPPRLSNIFWFQPGEISGRSQGFATRSRSVRCFCLTLGALLAAMAAFACRDQPPPPAPPPPQPPHDGVTLIQPGTTPRQVLRYHLTRGTKVTSQLECDADVKSPELASAMPVQVIQLETAVDDVLADGAARLRITVVDATVRERTTPPALAQAHSGSANAAAPDTASPSAVPPSAAQPSTAQPSAAQPSNPAASSGPPSNGRAATKTAKRQASIAEAAMGDASGGDPSTGPDSNSAANAAAAHSGAAIAGAASSGAGGNHAVRSGAVSSGALGGAAAGGKPPNAAAATPHSPPGDVSIDVMRAQAAAMRGVVITETLAPDGTVSEAHVESGASTDKIRSELDALLHSLEHVATRLPSEPVGLGAIWRERRTLPEGGVRAVSEITYTLASITGSTLGFTSTGASSGDAQTIEQEGTKLEVTNTHGSSTASGSVDLARYAIDVEASSSFATTMKEVAAPAGSGDGKSTIEIAMTIRLTSAPAAITASAPGATPAAGDSSPNTAAAVAAPTATAPPPTATAPPPAAAPGGTASPATEHGTR